MLWLPRLYVVIDSAILIKDLPNYWYDNRAMNWDKALNNQINDYILHSEHTGNLGPDSI